MRVKCGSELFFQFTFVIILFCFSWNITMASMVSTVKKKPKAATLGVRFSGTDALDRPGILKTDGRRLTKAASDNIIGNIDSNGFMSSKTWVMSTGFLLCLIVALTYRGYLDTQAVNYPYQGPKVIQKNSGVDQTLWGTYRPGAYLGLRTKEPLEKGSAAAGLMWYSQHNLMTTGSIDSSVRHMCDNGHENLVYGYVEHNAVNYGHQIIKDGKYNGFTLQTIFLRPDKTENESASNSGLNTDWTTRIIYETNNSVSSVSLVWYVYIDPGDDETSLNNQEYSLDILKNEDEEIGTPLATITGSTPSLSNFLISVIPTASNSINNSNKLQINTSISGSWCPNAAMLKHCLARTMVIKRQSLKEPETHSQVMLMDEKVNKPNSQSTSDLLRNFVAVQITINHSDKKSSGSPHKYSYSLDIAYTQKHKKSNTAVFQKTPPSLIDSTFDLVHNKYSKKFQQRFQKTFPISKKNIIAENSQWQYFAKVTFSNMAGSIGYFYGSSLVRDDDLVKNVDTESKVDTTGAVKYWRAGLLTTVPSRSQFPRGFLWDDGFHGLMIGSWSIELQLNILGHWMDLLNYQGWIPREQILGSEARSRVPEEFVVQGSKNANPPALLLTIDLLLRRIKQSRSKINAGTSNNEKLKFDEIDETLKRLFPRIKAWYNWFNNTQRSVDTKHSTLSDPNGSHLHHQFVGYRWRGRNSHTNRELNPKTLTSGMDDFPRSSHPVNSDGTSNVNVFGTYINENNFEFYESERHVDLHCWMTHGARILSSFHNYLYPSGDTFDNKYSVHFNTLVESLDSLHWTGKNSDLSQKSTSKMPMYADYGVHTDDVRLENLKEIDDSIRIVGQRDPPRWRFVDTHIGYNALFPMFFRLVKNSQRLNSILDLIEGTNNSENQSLLTKGCGLRSLSKSSSLYNARNTKHDPPYWRGTVWINMQYLACSSLYYYANLPEETEPMYGNNDEFNNLEPIQYLDLKTKQRCNRLYNKIRNDVIQCVYKEWTRTGYVWEQYEDEPTTDSVYGLVHKGKGTRPFTGWSANVVLLMAEIY